MWEFLTYKFSIVLAVTTFYCVQEKLIIYVKCLQYHQVKVN